MQVEGHFVLNITNGVCVAVTTLAQSSSLPKSACRVVLNVSEGMLIGDSSVVSSAAKASWVVMYTMNNP